MKNLLWATLIVGLTTTGVRADDKQATKDALKELQEFIGGWKGNGGPAPGRPPSSSPLWSETIEWGWNFKGDIAITLKIEKGKHFKSGTVTFDPKKKKYILALVDLKDNKREFEGEIEKNVLRFQRTDPDTKEVQKLSMNTAAEGVRFIYLYERKADGKTLFIKDYQVAATKIGESLGKTEKKNECVVSGGVGTTAVTFKGETFYVCCSGCRDEFNANPEKYVKEFKAKQGK